MYAIDRFDFMNMSPMQNPSDLYPYYPASLYQPFGTFDEHNQWTSTDTSAGIPPPPAPLPYHPSMYTTSGLDMSRSPFEYPQAHAYPHYHPAFTPSTFPGAPSTGSSTFDMSWNSHSLPMQIGVQQQMPPIGGSPMTNKKPSVYDEYPSISGGVGDMLAQHISSLDLSNNNNNIQHYDNCKNDHTQHNVSVLSLTEQQTYQPNSSNPSFTRPSQTSSSSGPKSYASVVSSDTINLTSNKPTSSISNLTIHSTNERTSHFSNDTFNTRSNTQQLRNSTTGYNPRNHQQQQQSSGSGDFLNWTNTNSDRSSHNNNNNNTKRQNYSSSRTTNGNQESAETLKHNHQYNPKDFNLNPKGARFFVIKSYSEDDVHRSIKYNIWCSTEHGNKRLDSAFREREGKGPVYLFFSVNASGHFCGMAEMMSPVDYEHQTDVWQMSNKWQGKFEVKWIYVKDVPNQQFRNIRLENNENKPVTNSRDTQEIPYDKGKLMLKTLHMYRHKTSIFDDFQYYESKQAEETTTKQIPNNDFNHNKRQLSSNRTSTTVQLEQQQNEHNHEN
ncbi:unnamed protein product [Rotaria sp. Silwood1]|nr:unnamed protein product [Rotaria sp. Silwood1]CAF3385288.1 unnamed protein product [Rotaria sp. Silwood1]CAF4539585.1 unnamed protein product [Rotaria sp. Silwood1]